MVLPSETQSREFDPKLLLACVLAERGLSVVVGSRVAIHNSVHRLAPRIYLAKDFRKPSNRIFRILRNLGSTILAWDEEGVLMFSKELYFERRVHPDTLAMIEQFFAWGPKNASLIGQAPGYHGQPIHLTGNPRIDVTRPEVRGIFDGEVKRLRDLYGEFILINTNFGMMNHYLQRHAVRPGSVDSSTGKKTTSEMNEAWEHQSKLLEAFKQLIVPLADHYPNRTIVVRPHPTENTETWRQASAGRSNVVVIHEGAVQPWLLACSAMIHSSCTTGIEGYLLDRRVVSYRPVLSKKFDHRMSNDLSHQAFSQDELFSMIDLALAGKWPKGDEEGKFQIASELFAGLRGKLSVDGIADVLASTVEATRTSQQPSRGKRVAGVLHSWGRSTYRWPFALLKGNKHSHSYTNKRFPGVSQADVQRRIGEFGSVLGRFAQVKATELSPNILLISLARS